MPEEIVKKITRRYQNVQRYLKEFDGNDVLQTYLNALARTYDPHSDYMGRNQAENFKISMQLSLSGIGAQLMSEDGYCKINLLMPGGPAELCKKLRPNDRIIAVAQGDQEPVDIVDMKLDKAVQLIRGPKGTEVRLTILPASATDPSVRRVVTLIRDEIKLEKEEAKAKIVDLTCPERLRLAVIDLPSFYAQLPSPDTTNELKLCATDVARLLGKLRREKVDGIVLDLRANGGGSLEEAIRLTGLFIPSGPVVQVRDWNGSVTVDTDDDPSVAYDGPLVVLTSRHSASASEILTGALQDYDRALVVGESSTFGKGTVQQLMRLEPLMRQYNYRMTNNPGELKFTIRKYYRINGTSTQLGRRDPRHRPALGEQLRRNRRAGAAWRAAQRRHHPSGQVPEVRPHLSPAGGTPGAIHRPRGNERRLLLPSRRHRALSEEPSREGRLHERREARAGKGRNHRPRRGSEEAAQSASGARRNGLRPDAQVGGQGRGCPNRPSRRTNTRARARTRPPRWGSLSPPPTWRKPRVRGSEPTRNVRSSS